MTTTSTRVGSTHATPTGHQSDVNSGRLQTRVMTRPLPGRRCKRPSSTPLPPRCAPRPRILRSSPRRRPRQSPPRPDAPTRSWSPAPTESNEVEDSEEGGGNYKARGRQEKGGKGGARESAESMSIGAMVYLHPDRSPPRGSAYVVNFAVNDDPAIVLAVVLGHLVDRKRLDPARPLNGLP